MLEDSKWELPDDDRSSGADTGGAVASIRRWPFLVLGISVCASIVWYWAWSLDRDERARAPTRTQPPNGLLQSGRAHTDKAPSSDAADPRPEESTNSAPTNEVEILKREVRDAASRVVSRFPGDPQSHHAMAGVHWLFGDPARAHECWQEALKLNSGFMPAYFGLADVALVNQQYEKIVDVMRRALAQSPTSSRARHELANALIGLGKFDEAVSILNQVAAAEESSWKTQSLLAKAYLQLEQNDEAKRHYEAAAQLKPNDRLAYYGLAMVTRRMGNHELAKIWLKRFQSCENGHARSTAEQYRADDIAKVQQYAAGTYILVGETWNRHGNLDEAEKHWLRAAALDPRSIRSRDVLRSLYERQERSREVGRMLLEINRIQSTFKQKP